MLTYRTLTTQQYVDAVVNLISITEGHIQTVTNIGDGKATIGYGYTFNRDDNVALWQAAGITLTVNQWAQLQQIDAASSTQKTSLALGFSRTLTHAEANALLEQTYQKYESPANELGMPESWERAALVSITYNRGEPAVHSKMQDFYNAVLTGNRAEAWFEIRYDSQTSNPDYVNGIAKRRYYEAETFSLYDDQNNVTEAEAKQVLQMYTRHHDEITAYEARYGVGFDGRVEGINAIDNANSDYHLSGADQVDTLAEALKPARAVLIDLYVTQKSIAININGEVLAGDYALDLYDHLIGRDETKPPIPQAPRPSNDLLIGGKGNDEVKGLAGDDVLYGEEGDDTLDGGDGDDRLLGGDGNDTYLLQTTSGIDTILDHSGNDQIQIDGTVVSGEFKPAVDGGKVYYSADKLYEWRLMLDTTTTTWRLSARDVGTGEYKVVADIDNWHSGEFGITLGAAEVPDPARVVLSYPNSVAYLNMNGAAATQGLHFDGGTKSDSFTGSNYSDVITTGGGLVNFVLSTYGGDDSVQGGDSRDYIRTGSNGASTTVSDNDYAAGGAQSDVLLGGYGSDQLWGDADNGDWLVAGTDSAERGDWLNGENGNDSLYGSRNSDVVFGGAGEDLLSACFKSIKNSYELE